MIFCLQIPEVGKDSIMRLPEKWRKIIERNFFIKQKKLLGQSNIYNINYYLIFFNLC